MLGLLSVLLCVIFAYFIQIGNIRSLLHIILIVNLIYVLKIIKNQGLSVAIRNIFLGEVVHSVNYIAWILYYPKESYIYFVPIFLSTLSKVYIVINSLKPTEKLDDAFIQEVILFQTKTEVFVLGYQILSLLFGQGTKILTQMLVLALICKFKYSLHHKSQLAYRQLHFGIDNCLKRTKFRAIYQVVYKLISMIGRINASQKSFNY